MNKETHLAYMKLYLDQMNEWNITYFAYPRYFHYGNMEIAPKYDPVSSNLRTMQAKYLWHKARWERLT